MKRKSRFTPTFLKIAIPFYLVLGVLVMGSSIAKSEEFGMVTPTKVSQLAVSETDRG